MGRAVSGEPVESLLTEVAGWKARGHALEAEGTPGALAAALRCYEAALARFRAGPLQSEAVRAEYGILWMNRGNALQKVGAPTDLAAAVRAYDEAIAQLPVAADPAAQNALGAAWLNRGRALQALGGPENLAEALRSLEQAVALLRPLAGGDDPHYQLNLAGACLNLAVLLAERGQLAAAADAVDEGLELARREGPAYALLRPLAGHLFLVGAQLYAVHQPQFLTEFLHENLDPADPAAVARAREAISRAQAQLGRPQILRADDPAAHRQLAIWRELAEFDLASVAPKH